MSDEAPIYNMPSMMITEGLLKQQIDAVTEITAVENHLLGRTPYRDPQTNEVKFHVDKTRRLINERGMNYLSSELRIRITKIFLLSHLEDDHVENLTIAFAKNMNKSLFEHWDDWELKANSDASAITGLMQDLFFVTLRKSSMGKYLAYLRHTQKFSEIQSLTAEQEQLPQQQDAMSNIPIIGGYFNKRK